MQQRVLFALYQIFLQENMDKKDISELIKNIENYESEKDLIEFRTDIVQS